MPEQSDKEFFNSFYEGAAPTESGSNTQATESQTATTEEAQPTEQGSQESQQSEAVFELNNEQGQPAEQTQTSVPSFEEEFQKRFGVPATAVKPEDLSGLETLRKKAEAKSYRSALGESFDELVAPVENGGKGIPPEVAIQYISDTSKLSLRDYRAMMMKFDYPQFSNEKIQDLIDIEYKLGKHAGVEDDDEPSVREEKERVGLLKLEKDVFDLRKKEGEFKKKLLEPFESRGKIEAQEKAELATKQAEKAEATRKEQWKTASKKLFDELKSFKIPIGEKVVGENGSSKKVPVGFYNFSIGDDLKKQITADVEAVIGNNTSLQPDETGQAWVKERLIKLAVLDRALPQIANALLNFGKSKEIEVWSKELNNGSIGGNQILDTGAQTKGKDAYDFALQASEKW